MINTHEELLQESKKILKLQSDSFQITINLTGQTQTVEAISEAIRIGTSKTTYYTTYTHA
ncbi:hypothetical protein MmiHf6_12810 [Methanimicrococcus hongohii]|uniref:Uncharacterized protein n=1 Tax=Methanimicrococcus hongohii TaxID=3028295 RepID=A0AA96VBP3_9EURY|nr:hypothetical protein [Methanimicrococcus sp. Hf6]WNY23957.1 hypothetical protein MmiHf6_12810 [Methanimicrococcus sp. Hf6]